MSIGSWFRGLFKGPSHVDSDAGADLENMAAGRAMNEPYAAMEAAEAARAEIEADEAGPEPGP